MGQKANLNSLRIGYVHSWKSEWFGDSQYSNYLSKEYRIREYLTNIFFNLKLPTSQFQIKFYISQLITIDFDLYLPADIKEKFYLFRYLESEIYDCFDSIIYYLKNLWYTLGISNSGLLSNFYNLKLNLVEVRKFFQLLLIKQNSLLSIPIFSYYHVSEYSFVNKLLYKILVLRGNSPFYILINTIINRIFVHKSHKNSLLINKSVEKDTIQYSNLECLLSLYYKIYIHINFILRYIISSTKYSIIQFLKKVCYYYMILKIITSVLVSNNVANYYAHDINIQQLFRNIYGFFSLIHRTSDFAMDIERSFVKLGNFFNRILRQRSTLFNICSVYGLVTTSLYTKFEILKYLIVNYNSTYLIFETIYNLCISPYFNTLKSTISFVSNYLKILILLPQSIVSLSTLFLIVFKLQKWYINIRKLYDILSSYLHKTSYLNSINISYGFNTFVSIWHNISNILELKLSVYKNEYYDSYFFKNIVFKQLNNYMEYYISVFTKLDSIILPNIYIQDTVPLLSSKLIAQYISYELEKGSPIAEIFRDIKAIHISDIYRRNEFFKRVHRLSNTEVLHELAITILKQKSYCYNLNNAFNQERVQTLDLSLVSLFNYVLSNYDNSINSKIVSSIYVLTLFPKINKWVKTPSIFTYRIGTHLMQLFNFVIHTITEDLQFLKLKSSLLYLKQNPIEGIRISASGSFKRGTEATVKWYVDGKMPRQSLAVDVEQYVNHAFTRNGVLGVKVLFYFNSNHFEEDIELKSEEFLDTFNIKLEN